MQVGGGFGEMGMMAGGVSEIRSRALTVFIPSRLPPLSLALYFPDFPESFSERYSYRRVTF